MPQFLQIPEDQWARRRCAYELTKPTMSAIPVSSLIHVDVDIPATALLVRSKIPKIQALRSNVASSLADFDMRTIDRLDLYVQAMCYAHWLFQSTLVSVDRLQDWLDEWPAQQKRLLVEANRLATAQHLKHCRVELCPLRVGHQSGSTPLKRIFCLLYQNFAHSEGNGGLLLHEVMRAELLAELTSIVSDCNGDLFAAKAAVVLNRQRAFTVFMSSYDQVRRAMQFIRWNLGDADDIAPALERQPRRHRVDSSPPMSARFPIGYAIGADDGNRGRLQRLRGAS